MNNRNIILLAGVVVLLGGVIFYLRSQSGSDAQFADSKQVAVEKPSEKANVEPGLEANNAPTPEIADTKEIENSTIYYYGAECPHCKDVLAYFDQNDIYNKVDFTKKEVWNNKANGEELRNAALKCGMNPANIGVPFVFSKGKCYMGGPDVMDFFAEAAGIKK